MSSAGPSGRQEGDGFGSDLDLGFVTVPVGASAEEVYDFVDVNTVPSSGPLQLA